MKLLYIDLFCGAGGTSTGVNLARVNGQECARVIACVNHDAKAIASHASNHPDAMHFTEDIRTLEMTPLVEHLKKCRTMNPDAFVVLWASLECTNFSKAKGGQPRDADSRTLAEHLFRYIEAIDPDYIQIENVEEFMSWGGVDENGKPISMDKGKAYCRWIRNVKKYGYDFAHRILNAADFGAYTSRKRFFGIFAKKGLPITFPEPTHAKNPEPGLFGSLQRWKPVKDVLDFSDEGRSIFGREKPLSEKTLERIFAGLVKFVAGGKDKFMVKYNSMNQAGRYQAPSVDEPCPVVATQNRLAVAQVSFLSKQFGGHPESKNCSTDEPAGTNPGRHGIHQISGEIVIDGKSVETFDFKVQPNPKAQIEDAALAVGGVTREQIMAYPPMGQVYTQLVTMLAKYVNKYDKTDKFHLVGYNNRGFDDNFFRGFFLQNGDNYFGSWFWADSIDVLVLASTFLADRRADLPNFKLATVADFLGIDTTAGKLHDASFDIYVTKAVFDFIMSKFINRGK